MRLIIVLLISAAVAGCSSEKAVDEALAKDAQVVLRVDCQAEAETCEKYCWQNVTVLKVIKNKSDSTFHKRIEVAHYNWERGVPIGISTIYLEKYDPSRKDVWRLVDGSATSGVSHSEQSRRQDIITETRPTGRRIIRVNGEEPNS